MMLKVNNEFINLPDEPEVVRQTKTADLLDSDGDFSYEFFIPDTSENRRKLGCLSYNTFDIDSELINENGYTLYSGITSIERFLTGSIACSFKSGNTNWISILSNKLVSDIPVFYTERFKMPVIATSPSAALVASWSKTEGIVFPLTDRGRLRSLSIDRLTTGDFQPWVFIRDVLIPMFQSNGIKLEGELLNDGLFNTLIISGLSGFNIETDDSNLPYYDGFYSFIGKTSQTLTTTPQKVLFTLENYPYINGSFNPWDSSLSRYTNNNIDLLLGVSANFTFSAPVAYTVELRVNGVVSSSKTSAGTGTYLSFSDRIGYASLDVGDYFEVWAYITSGTVDINTGGSVKVEPYRLNNYYPQYLVGDMTQTDLVKSVFTMFNVIPTYNKETKTLTANLFENLRNKEAVDLSEYISSYEINAVDILSELAKDIILTHQSIDTDQGNAIAKSLGIPFGAAKISPDRVLSDTKEIETAFTAPIDYFNERLRASLMDMNVITFDVDESTIDIASVADDGSGNAEFTTTESHGLNPLDYVYISNTSNNAYIGLGRVNAVVSDTVFEVAFLPFVGTTTGSVSKVSRSFDYSKIYIASYFPSMSVSDFSFNSTVNYEGTYYSEIAWAFFLKQSFGLPIDDLRKSPAFGKDPSNFSITLEDSYYDLYRRSINKPITLNASMLIPEKVYINMDLSAPFTINTPEFSWRFFLRKDTGYRNSYTECEFELLKLV